MTPAATARDVSQTRRGSTVAKSRGRWRPLRQSLIRCAETLARAADARRVGRPACTKRRASASPKSTHPTPRSDRTTDRPVHHATGDPGAPPSEGKGGDGHVRIRIRMCPVRIVRLPPDLGVRPSIRNGAVLRTRGGVSWVGVPDGGRERKDALVAGHTEVFSGTARRGLCVVRPTQPGGCRNTGSMGVGRTPAPASPLLPLPASTASSAH